MSQANGGFPSQAPPNPVLYAEDQEFDILFLQNAFRKAGISHHLVVVRDGEEALQYLSGSGSFGDRQLHPLPCLVILDVKMPRKTGLEVLAWIREQPRLKSIPVLMLTSSDHPADIAKARELAADDYLVKPCDPAKLAQLVANIRARWLAAPSQFSQTPLS